MRKHMKTLEPLKDGNRQETLLLGWWRNWGFLAWQFLDFAVEAAKRGLRKLGKTGDWSVRSIFGGFHKWGGSPKWMVYGNLYLDPLIADIAVGVFVFELHLIDEKELKWFSRCFFGSEFAMIAEDPRWQDRPSSWARGGVRSRPAMWWIPLLLRCSLEVVTSIKVYQSRCQSTVSSLYVKMSPTTHHWHILAPFISIQD